MSELSTVTLHPGLITLYIFYYIFQYHDATIDVYKNTGIGNTNATAIVIPVSMIN